MSDATNVVEALASVMRDLPGIGKSKHPSADGKGITYAYRGIEEITSEVQGLFAKYGVVCVPRVRSRSVVDITVNDKPWTDTYLEVNWDIYGPGGLEDCLSATTYGHGRDNSDKGTNKAQTQAFKYLLLDLLCISDPADDNDGTNVAADARSAPRGAPVAQPAYEEVNGGLIPLDVPMESTRTGPESDLCSTKQANYSKALLLGLGLDTDEKLVTWFATNELGPWPGSFNNLSKVQASQVIERTKP